MTNKLAFVLPTIMLLLTACGEDSNGDNTPNILTGLSGIVILIIVIWVIVKALTKD